MRTLAAVVALAVLSAPAVPAQAVRYVDGLFIHTGDAGPIELIAWAESTSRGQLRMSRGTLEDAPEVDTVARVLCSIPLWQPVGVFVSSGALFRDEFAERRRLSFAVRKLNIYAMEVRIVDLERRDKIDSLLEAVRASGDQPGYAFIVLSSGDYQRFYPVRLTPGEP